MPYWSIDASACTCGLRWRLCLVAVHAQAALHTFHGPPFECSLTGPETRDPITASMLRHSPATFGIVV